MTVCVQVEGSVVWQLSAITKKIRECSGPDSLFRRESGHARLEFDSEDKCSLCV